MRSFGARALAILLLAPAAHAQEFFDTLRDRLTLNAFDDKVRVRLSGTIDLEYYRFNSRPRH
jgi:hypothetical protein